MCCFSLTTFSGSHRCPRCYVPCRPNARHIIRLMFQTNLKALDVTGNRDLASENCRVQILQCANKDCCIPSAGQLRSVRAAGPNPIRCGVSAYTVH